MEIGEKILMRLFLFVFFSSILFLNAIFVVLFVAQQMRATSAYYWDECLFSVIVLVSSF